MGNIEILGSALGECLSRLGSLSAAYIPDGVHEDTVLSLVRRANAKRPEGQAPFAILVAMDDEDESDSTCIRLTPQSAIRYRQDDRLAVVIGRHPDLASFMQAFRETLGKSYPADASGDVDLRNLASAALDEVFRVSGISIAKEWSRDTAVMRLESCLDQLGGVYSILGEGTRPWNAYWFDHVSEGLRNLANILQRKLTDEPSLNIDEALEKYIFASFALPKPSDGNAIRGNKRGAYRFIAEALRTWWSDEDTIITTVRQLAYHSDTSGDQHPLESVDWDGFDYELGAKDNHLNALLSHGNEQNRRNKIEAFAQLTESQFANPLGEGGALTIFGASGEDLGVAEGENEAPFILTSTLERGLGGSAAFISQPIRVKIPTSGNIAVTSDEAEQSTLELLPSMKSMSFEGVLENDNAGVLWAVGKLILGLGKKEPFNIQVRSCQLTVKAKPTDKLAAKLVTSATCELYLIPQQGPAILTLPIKKNGMRSKGAYVGPDDTSQIPQEGEANAKNSDSGTTNYQTTLADSISKHQILVWGATSPETLPRLNSRNMTSLKGRTGIFSAEFIPTGNDTVQSDGAEFLIGTPQAKALCHSPIIAAVDRQLVSTDMPSLSTVNSVRGIIERQLSTGVHDEDWKQALGHVVLPSDRALTFGNLVKVNNHLISTQDIYSEWSAVAGFEVPDTVVESDEAMEFRNAFSDLLKNEEISDLMTSSVNWPSKTSWRHLWANDRQQLTRYLNAYVRLIEKAKQIDDPAGVFWATYPFSVSVWDTTTSGKCQAVLLSPLHPLRLTWLASVEDTLWNASKSAALAGTIEGWNFPIIGPSETSNGKMLAVPLDSGEAQIFLGWSMLVEASIDGTRPLRPPTTVGNIPAPGSSGSGLNAAAAGAALRSYRNINPHVSTLTIDLASINPAARLTEMDEAVVTAIKTWAKNHDERLVGGVRVLDSLNRRGEYSREKALQLVRQTEGLPLTWSRYSPKASASQRCNIRLLQDSGVQLEVRSAGAGNMGLIGDVPLRRYEAHQPPNAGALLAESRPALRISSGWEPFSEALSIVEGSNVNPRIMSRLFKAMLVDERADWTVSGEAMISPSALAALVGNNGDGNQMLWEWRPPFLDVKSGVPMLERRPFVSVARIPGGFRTQVRSMLDKVRDRINEESAVNDLLAKLGARGVGLSSLLSMGGTHATGALGFYLSFSLLDRMDVGTTDQFVMPIDACDDFLQALVQTPTQQSSKRRADLLIIRLDDEAITLIPLEIKFYGLNSNDNNQYLPKPDESAFEEALEQLSSTNRLLEDVALRGRKLRESGDESDLALWSTGFAALVEAGARLRPELESSPDRFADRFQRLVRGELEVRVGHPLVNYFVHQSAGNRTAEYMNCYGTPATSSDALGEYGLLVANAGRTFDELDSPSSTLIAEWGETIRWASARKDTSTSGDSQESIDISETPNSRNRETGNPIRLPAPTATDLVSASSVFEPDVPAKEGKPTEKDLPLFRPIPKDVIERGWEPPTKDDFDAKKIIEVDGSATTNLSGEGVKFPVGELLGTVGDAVADFWPSNTALNQMNMGVVGDLGTGKTQLLKNLVFELRRASRNTQATPVSMLVFDYKRDFQDDAFLNAVGGHVLHPQRIPLNIFALPNGYSPLAAFQRAQAFCDVISKIYSNVGYNQRDRLVTVITGLFKKLGGKPPTLAQVLEGYREEGGKPDSVTGILNTFILGEIFSDDPDDLLSFEDLIEDKVLVVALSDLGADQNTKNALVILFLNLYYEYMIRSKKWPFEGSSPQLRRLNSYLLVDEAANIMKYEFPVLMDLMLQGREFGFGVILASQYLSHYKVGQTNYGEPLLTWFIHKVPNVTAKELEQLGLVGLREDVARRITKQQVHQALYYSLGHSGVFIKGTPFYQQLGVDEGSWK